MMHWVDDKLIEFDDVSLKVKGMTKRILAYSTRKKFVLAKTKEIITRYQNRLKYEKTERILELGIFKGGSAVLFYKMFNPKKLVAIELHKKRISALDEYITDTHIEDIIRPYYGINQADKQTLTEIIKTEFGDKPIDIVFDDASHFYEETKASFNTIFPYLRQGGFYIIEDWAWAHWPGDRWQKNGGVWKNKPALSNLVFELIMLCASHYGIIEYVDINNNNVIVKKGNNAKVDTNFDISKLYNNRGISNWYI